MRIFGIIFGAVLGGLYGLLRFGFSVPALVCAGIGALIGFFYIEKFDVGKMQGMGEWEEARKDNAWWKWWMEGFKQTSWKKSANNKASAEIKEEESPLPDEFTRILLSLMAAVAQADGDVSDDEVRRVRRYFLEKFGFSQAEELVKIFEFQAFQSIDYVSFCRTAKEKFDYYTRLQLLGLLADLASADHDFSLPERELLDNIAAELNIQEGDREYSVKSFADTDSPYAALGIVKDSDDDAIRSAYRKLVLQYHPDKVIHLGPEYVKVAREKFDRIHEAYENIKAERQFN